MFVSPVGDGGSADLRWRRQSDSSNNAQHTMNNYEKGMFQASSPTIGIGAFVTPAASFDAEASPSAGGAGNRSLLLHKFSADDRDMKDSLLHLEEQEPLPSPSVFREMWKDREPSLVDERDTAVAVVPQYLTFPDTPSVTHPQTVREKEIDSREKEQDRERDVILTTSAVMPPSSSANAAPRLSLLMPPATSSSASVMPQLAQPVAPQTLAQTQAPPALTQAQTRSGPGPCPLPSSLPLSSSIDNRLAVFGYWTERRPAHWLKVWQRVFIFIAGMEASRELSLSPPAASATVSLNKIVIGGHPFAKELFDRFYGNAERGIVGVLSRALAGQLDVLWYQSFPVIRSPVHRITEDLIAERLPTRSKLLRYFKDYIVGEIVSSIVPAYRQVLAAAATVTSASATGSSASQSLSQSLSLYEVLERTLIVLWSHHEDARILALQRKRELEERERESRDVKPPPHSVGQYEKSSVVPSSSLAKRPFPGVGLFQPLSFLVFLLFGPPAGRERCWPLFRIEDSLPTPSTRTVGAIRVPSHPLQKLPVVSSQHAQSMVPATAPLGTAPQDSLSDEHSGGQREGESETDTVVDDAEDGDMVREEDGEIGVEDEDEDEPLHKRQRVERVLVEGEGDREFEPDMEIAAITADTDTAEQGIVDPTAVFSKGPDSFLPDSDIVQFEERHGQAYETEPAMSER